MGSEMCIRDRTIVDPHIKRDNNYPVHKEATNKGLYIKDKDGKVSQSVSVDQRLLGSNRIGSDRTGSDRIGSDRVGSDRIGSDRIGSDRIGSDRIGSDRIGSERFEPE